MKIPERGDIILTNLSPASGREQKGYRPCIVISHHNFNKSLKMAYICSITSKVRGNIFEVIVNTNKTKGVALTHQVKVIDLSSRKYTIVDKVNLSVVEEIIKKVKNIID